MIALAIIAIAFVAFMNSFSGIAVAIQTSKTRTLATNLAQEKIQILQQVSYNRLMVTPAPQYRNEVTPSVPYDATYYVPEVIREGGITFERLTFVQMASDVNGSLVFLGATPDTGMKAITVTVLWREKSKTKSLQLKSMYANPNTVRANAEFKGIVRDAVTGTPISNAAVLVAENNAWQDMTLSTGTYSINLYDGTYTLVCTARGYFTQSIFRSIGPYQSLTQNFNLAPMGQGKVQGTAWIRDHLVISQVVASTHNYTTDYTQEYVELFNPTTWTWTMASAGTAVIDLYRQRQTNPHPDKVILEYANPNSVIPPSRYYLIANTTTITAAGVTRDADAVYSPSNDGFPNIIKDFDNDGGGDGAGAVGILSVANDKLIDAVGWDRNSSGASAPYSETEGIDQGIGFQMGEQYVRRCSTMGYISGIGRCYDSNNNNKDFLTYQPIQRPPRNSTDQEPSVAGTPAFGAIVTSEDGLSLPTTAAYTNMNSIPYAQFQLLEVATGTWTVYIASNNFSIDISTVIISFDGEHVSIPNASTFPTWTAAGHYSVALTSSPESGFIGGDVLNAAGMPITPAIKVRASSVEVAAQTTNGHYVLSLSTGTYSVTANPGNVNPQYVSQTIENITVELGKVTSNVDFILSQGGRIRGWVTKDGINPLPDISVVALNQNGANCGQEVSASDGSFLLVNLATGTYAIEPVLDSGEISLPSSYAATVTVGNTVSVGTFTIVGAFGKITGSVTKDSEPISTGVLIIASTVTFTGPPSLSSATLSGSPYYFANSYENGTYSLEVRGSSITKYNVRAYYPETKKSGVTLNTDSQANITVNPSQTTPGVNFTW